MPVITVFPEKCYLLVHYDMIAIQCYFDIYNVLLFTVTQVFVTTNLSDYQRQIHSAMHEIMGNVHNVLGHAL